MSQGHLAMHNDVKFGKITLRDLYVARCILASILARAEQELQKKIDAKIAVSTRAEAVTHLQL